MVDIVRGAIERGRSGPVVVGVERKAGRKSLCLSCLQSCSERLPDSETLTSAAFNCDCVIFPMFGRIGGGQALRCAARRPLARRKVCDRKFSAQTGPNAAPAAPSPLGSITVELDRIAPRFEISASQVTILDSPANFYSTLKVRCLQKSAMFAVRAIANE